MRRFRLSTLLLLVVIAAQGLGLAIQEVRHRRREAELRARIDIIIKKCEQGDFNLIAEFGESQSRLNDQDHSSVATGGASDGK
jgi:hypothetical protein